MRKHLTTKQKLVIETLALKGPMTGYDFHCGGEDRKGRKKIISSGQWQTTRTKLGPKGLNLIEELKGENIKEKWLPYGRGKRQRGDPSNRKKHYWLTNEGFNKAITLKMPSKKLFYWIEKIYNKLPEDIRMLRDYAQELGDDKLFRNVIDSFAWENGQFVIKYIPLGKNGKKYGKALKKVMIKYSQTKTIQDVKAGIDAGIDGIISARKELEE